MNRFRIVGVTLLVVFALFVLAHNGALGRWTSDVTGGAVVSDATGNQTGPRAVSDGAGGMILVWEDTRNGNKDIYAQRLDNAGAPIWTADGVAVCSSAGDQSNPQIVEDGSSGAIIVWQDARGANVDVYAQRLNSSGAPQWLADGAPICVRGGDQTVPQVAGAGSGASIVTWQDTFNGNADIYCAKVVAADGSLDATGSWAGTFVAVCTNATAQANPQIDDDNNGGAFVTWEDARNGTVDVYIQYVNSSGATTWANGREMTVLPAAGNQTSPRIVADATGAVVVWQDNRSGNEDLAARRITVTGNYPWGAAETSVIQAAGDQTNPRLTAAGASGYLIAWQDNNSGNWDIYARNVSSGGVAQGTGGVVVCNAAGDQTNPRIASDTTTGAIVVWQDNRGGTNDIYAQRINGSATPQWATANGNVVNQAAGSQESPVVVVDATTGAMIAWQDQRSGNYDIYAQRVKGDGTMSNDWPTTTDTNLAICTQTGLQNMIQVVADGREGAIVVWQDYRGADSDIYAQRVNATGSVMWGADGKAVSVQTGIQTNPQVASDGAGGAIVVWQDYRNGADYDIYAARVDVAGNVGAEIPVCVAAGNQIIPRIVANGASGAIVVWQSDLNGDDIFAAGIDAAGAVTFGQNGVTPVCTATGDQENPRLVDDGAGGAIFVWQDYRSGTSLDIYAQRYNGTGAAPGGTSWPVNNGAPVCVDPANQTLPQIVSDGAGGAIIAWSDARAGNADIYAHRITAGGTLVATWAGATGEGIAICDNVAAQTSPSLSSDGAGGALVAWVDFRNSSPDIYAVRYSGAGALVAGWTDDGNPVCAETSTQSAPHVVEGGSGSAVIVWNDDRNSATAGTDLYAMKLAGDGTVPSPWTTNGIPVASQTNSQLVPSASSIASDGAGGAIAAWEDNRGADTNIYAQWIYASGNNLTYVPGGTGGGGGGTTTPTVGAGGSSGHSGGCFIETADESTPGGVGVALLVLAFGYVMRRTLAPAKQP